MQIQKSDSVSQPVNRSAIKGVSLGKIPVTDDFLGKEDSFTVQQYAANNNFDASAEAEAGKSGTVPGADNDYDSLMELSPNADADDATIIVNVAKMQTEPVDSGPREASVSSLTDEQKPQNTTAS